MNIIFVVELKKGKNSYEKKKKIYLFTYSLVCPKNKFM